MPQARNFLIGLVVILIAACDNDSSYSQRSFLVVHMEKFEPKTTEVSVEVCGIMHPMMQRKLAITKVCEGSVIVYSNQIPVGGSPMYVTRGFTYLLTLDINEGMIEVSFEVF